MLERYSGWVTAIVLTVIAAAIYVDLPNSPGLHVGPFERDFRVVRGLDLQGGLRVLMQADLPEDQITEEQMQTARDIVENRVNALGVVEPVVQVAGDNRILVELPGVEDPQQAIDTIQETGLLEFVEMDPQRVGATATLPGAEIRTDFGMAPTPTVAQTEPPTATPDAATEAAAAELTPQASPTPPIFHTVMTGVALEDARAGRDPVSGEYLVQFDLTAEGAETFGEYTSANVGGYLAIVLDKRIISVPRIQSAITGGRGTITGNFTAEEANQLAVQLRYGSLPVPLDVLEIKRVGPTLGQDSLDKSAVAGVVGFLIVMVFMGLHYRLPGLLADLALVVYALVTFAMFKIVPVTLTLPGIAGFILSIGVAVDANILIFERMKEELRAGKTLRNSIALGFERAWPSIRDSNLSTLLTCAILFWFGSTFGASIVQGFALTLAIGVIVSLFSAITVTRLLLNLTIGRVDVANRPGWFGI